MKNIITLLLSIITLTVFSQDCSTFKVESQSIPANCYGGDGKILLTKVEGGSGYGTYKYEWTNGDTTQNITAPAGMYNVVVTDSNGCIIMLKDTITEPNIIEIESVVVPGDGEASITTVVTGGVGPYTYQHFELKNKKPKSIKDLNKLKTGYYRTRVTDSVGCTMETFGWVQVKDVDVADKTYLKVYPNPANIYIVIEYKVNDRVPYVLNITSVGPNCNTVYETTLDPNGNKLEMMVNTLPEGIYNVGIYGNKKLASTRLVINH